MNSTGAAVTVGVTQAGGSVFQQVTVAAGSTEVLRIKGSNQVSYDLEYRRLDTGKILATFVLDGFVCDYQVDQSARAVSGTPTKITIVCATGDTVVDRPPLHGSLRRLPLTDGPISYIYISDAGYVGPDRFHFICQSERLFGTVSITVVAAAAPRQATPPAAPNLPATGSTISGAVMAGGGLLLVGAILFALTRRRA